MLWSYKVERDSFGPTKKREFSIWLMIVECATHDAHWAISQRMGYDANTNVLDCEMHTISNLQNDGFIRPNTGNGNNNHNVK